MRKHSATKPGSLSGYPSDDLRRQGARAAGRFLEPPDSELPGFVAFLGGSAHGQQVGYSRPLRST